MKFDLINFFEQKRKKGGKIEKIVGNLPYYISISLIRQILELNRYLKLTVFLVQKEVGERLMAQAGNKNYGILSLVAQYYSKPQKVHIVPSTVFYPQPKVSSMIIKLDIYKKPRVQVGNEKLFFNIIRASFQQRRKRLINSLSNYFSEVLAKAEIENILIETGIDKNRRGETLTLEEFAKLSMAMGNKLA
jgi:16S rRNA (adenine1518-N6/adenine1519-N6)-dimethyltransferase